MRSEPLLILILILISLLISGAPPNTCRITGTPSVSEVPSVGAKRFWLLLALFQKWPAVKAEPTVAVTQITDMYLVWSNILVVCQPATGASSLATGPAPYPGWCRYQGPDGAESVTWWIDWHTAIGGKPPPTFGSRP